MYEDFQHIVKVYDEKLGEMTMEFTEEEIMFNQPGGKFLYYNLANGSIDSFRTASAETTAWFLAWVKSQRESGELQKHIEQAKIAEAKHTFAGKVRGFAASVKVLAALLEKTAGSTEVEIDGQTYDMGRINAALRGEDRPTVTCDAFVTVSPGDIAIYVGDNDYVNSLYEAANIDEPQTDEEWADVVGIRLQPGLKIVRERESE